MLRSVEIGGCIYVVVMDHYNNNHYHYILNNIQDYVQINKYQIISVSR